MANIRIKDQTTDTALVAGDYVIVDNATEGTRKFDLGQKLVDIDDDFTDVRQDFNNIENSINFNDLTFSLETANRMISNDFSVNRVRVTQTDTNYQFYLSVLSLDGRKLREEPLNWTNDYIFEKTPEVGAIRIYMRKSNNANFSDATEGLSTLIIQNIPDLYYKEKYKILHALEFERGSFDAHGKISATNRVRTKDICFAKKGSSISIPSGYRAGINLCNEFGELVSDLGWKTNTVYVFAEDSYFMLVLANTSNSTVYEDIASKYTFNILQNDDSDIELLVVSLPLIGDCMAMKFKQSNKVMLIDIGRSADYALIKTKLQGYGITKIDYLMISHYHDDHVTVAGLTNLISDFDLSSCVVLLPPTVPDSYVGNQWTTGAEIRTTQSNIKTLLTDNNITYKDSYYPQGRLKMHLCGVPFILYNTDQSDLVEQNADYNELSLVALLQNGKTNILFTGDMMVTLEQKLINEITQSINICKFGHHGLNAHPTNIYPDFFHKIKPDMFFSCSPSDTTTYATNYSNSGQIRYANYNGVKNIMTGISGDLYFKISNDGYSCNGTNYRLQNLKLSEFETYTGFSS